MSLNLLINESPLVIQPTLAALIGLNEAIVLQQVHYWLNPRLNKRVIDGRRWVHNTYGQWRQQFSFFSELTIRRTFKGLERLGILDCSFHLFRGRKSKFYTINYEALQNLVQKLQENNPCFNGEKRAPHHSNHFSDGMDVAVLQNKGKESFVESCEGVVNQYDVEDNDLIDSNWVDYAEDPSRGHFDQLEFALENSEFPDDDDGAVLRTTPEGAWLDLSRAWRYFPETSENEGNPTSGQNDQNNMVNLISSPLESDQLEHSSMINLTTTYTENTSENTSPPPKGSSSNVKLKAEEEEEVDLDSLVSVWNETVQTKLKNPFVVLTEQRTQALQSIFRTHFNGRREAWKSYCEKISGTKFLMGGSESGFRVNFDWAINPANVAKVLEGAIYDRPTKEEKAEAAVSPLPWEEFAQEMRELHVDKGYPFTWTNVCLSLAKQTNQSVAKTLFGKIHPGNLSGSVAQLEVPFQFILDQIRDRHMPKLKAAIRAEYPHVADVSFEVRRAI